ncbi:MAG TPA: redoxin domain-containing protein [Chloroflexota bacterium]
MEQLFPLPPGVRAPDFTLPHTLRQTLSLHTVHHSSVVLVFYPFDWEPVSREQLALYQDYLVEFDRLGASLLGISVDQVWSHGAFAREVRIGFPLLSDATPRGTVSRLYGVYREREERSSRALVAIDEDGVIRFSQVYPDELNPGVNDILTACEAIAAEDTAALYRRTHAARSQSVHAG